MSNPHVIRGNSIYSIAGGPTWHNAEANANKLGGHLVTINDAEENQWLVDNLSGRDDYYNIGYYDQYWIGLDQILLASGLGLLEKI